MKFIKDFKVDRLVNLIFPVNFQYDSTPVQSLPTFTTVFCFNSRLPHIFSTQNLFFTSWTIISCCSFCFLDKRLFLYHLLSPHKVSIRKAPCHPVRCSSVFLLFDDTIIPQVLLTFTDIFWDFEMYQGFSMYPVYLSL